MTLREPTLGEVFMLPLLLLAVGIESAPWLVLPMFLVFVLITGYLCFAVPFIFTLVKWTVVVLSAFYAGVFVGASRNRK